MPEQVEGPASLTASWSRAMTRQGLARGTLTVRARRLRSWLAFTGDQWPVATYHDVDAWIDEHTGEWCPRTTASAIGHVRAFYKWARREGLAHDDPTALVDAPRARQPLVQVPTDAELRRALDLLADPWRVAVVVAAGAGLRCCEVVALDWYDVDLARGRVKVRAGKGGKGRVPGISPQMRAELARYDAASGPVLGRHMTPERLSQGANAALRAAGVGQTMHRFRHWYATAMLAGGADLEMVRQALGHVSIATTQRYLHVESDAVTDAAEAIRWV